MQELIVTGRTVDEAVASACAQMGLSRDAVNVEVLDLPQKKLFGSTPAKVRVTEREDMFSVKDLLMGREEKQEPAPAEQPAAAPAAPKEAAPAPSKEREIPPCEKSHEIQPSRPEQEQPVVSKPSEEAASEQPTAAAEVEEEEIPEDSLTAPAAAALAYYKQMAEGMGALRLSYKVVRTERGVKFVVDGEDASLVIGRRGETMDAMQYLCMLISSRTEGDYCKITVDVSGYRKKREVALIALAKREADKVLRSRYDQALEPMNPYERRIIHSTVQEIEGVKSESTGTEPHRRVVISLTSGGRSRRDRDRDRGRGGRPRHDAGPSRPRPQEAARPAPERPAKEQPAPAMEQPAPAPRTESSTQDNKADMLYKKIEL